MRKSWPREAALGLLFAACVLLALVMLTSCADGRGDDKAAKVEVRGGDVVFPANAPALARLATEKVMPPTARELAMPGRLVWDEDRTVRVFPPFTGRVERVLAQVGDRVAAGQPLAEVSSPDFAQAQADARKARADMDLAARALERSRELHANGVASRRDFEQAQADADKARAESDRANARLAAYRAGESGERFILKSPMGGTVVERNLNPGQELRIDASLPPLFVVTDPAHLWIMLDAPEVDLRGVKSGMPLAIGTILYPDEKFDGVLKQVADFVDPNSRTLKLRGEVPNGDRRLKGEMFVTARLKLPAGDRATADARAIYLADSRRYAFVRTAPNAFARREVAVGPEVEGRVEVRSGLEPGDEVVVAGNLFLQQMVAAARRDPSAADKSVAKVP